MICRDGEDQKYVDCWCGGTTWIEVMMCTVRDLSFFCFFFFNDTATTEIYTLSLHDALPILCVCVVCVTCMCLCW